MSVVIIVLAAAVTLAVIVVKALAVDEVKGRLQRHLRARLEATIAAMPEELQAQWGRGVARGAGHHHHDAAGRHAVPARTAEQRGRAQR